MLQSALSVVAMGNVSPFLTSDQTFAEQVYLVWEMWVWRHEDFLAVVNYKLDHFLPTNIKNLSQMKRWQNR